MTLAPNPLPATHAIRERLSSWRGKVKRFLNLQIIIIICDPSP